MLVKYIGPTIPGFFTKDKSYKVLSKVLDLFRIIDDSEESYLYELDELFILDKNFPINTLPEEYVGIAQTKFGNDSFKDESTQIIKTAYAEIAAAVYIEPAKPTKKHRNFKVKGDYEVGPNLNQRFLITDGSEVKNVIQFAKGKHIRDVKRLRRQYKISNTIITKTRDWRKMKGEVIAEHLRTNKRYLIEVHWYQCEGIGKKEFKYKKIIKEM